MTITVPTKKKTAAVGVMIPHAGRYRGLVKSAKVDNLEAIFEFSFRAPPCCTSMKNMIPARARRWTLPYAVPIKALGDVLIDLGMAGQEIEIEDTVGREAMVQVTTTGGRTGARITGIHPVDPLPEGT